MKGFWKDTVAPLLPAVVLALAIAGCTPPPAPADIPPPAPEPEVVKLDVPPKPEMFKVFSVLKDAGKHIQSHTSYQRYQSLSRDGVTDPEMFYDIYRIDTDQRGEWYRILFKTAARAMKSDSRIREKMANLPHQSLIIELRDRSGRNYRLIDSEADGVLDLAGKAGSQRSIMDVDLELLKRMQEKYDFIIGVIKKLYR